MAARGAGRGALLWTTGTTRLPSEKGVKLARRYGVNFPSRLTGVSSRNIALRLNADGIPGPAGQLWSGTTLRGHVSRGTGFLNNALHVGQLVWNRQRYVKDPSTGKRVSRINPESEWITTEVPELRIVDDALWQAVKARQAAIGLQFAGTIAAVRMANRLNAVHRPKSLLSGLVFCGVCGGPFTLRLKGRFGCSARTDNASCSNGHSIAREALEARVLDGLKERLMTPEAAAEAIDAYVSESNRLNQQRRASHAADNAELARIARTISEVLDAVEQGRKSDALFDRLEKLENRQKELKARLATAPADTPDIHPNLAEAYRRKVERLAEALNAPEERDEARDAIRSLIERVVLSPGVRRGEMTAILHGDFGAILDLVDRQTKAASGPCGPKAVMFSVVAGTRFHLNLRSASGSEAHDSDRLMTGLVGRLVNAAA